MHFIIETMLQHTKSISEILFFSSIGIAYITIIILYWNRWRDYFLPWALYKKKNDIQQKEDFPRVSVIVPSNNQADYLEKNLPFILEQNYKDFEVIVVNEASTDDTEEVIKKLQAKYPHLRTTFVPASTREISLRKLSLTLGIRAAWSEWIIITSAYARPATADWIKQMASHAQDNIDIILGYARYQSEQSKESPSDQRNNYERFKSQLLYYRAAYNGNAIGGDAGNLCIRKKAFLSNKGFAKHLHVPSGECDLLIQDIAQKGNAAIVIHPNAIITENPFSQPIFENMRILRRETLHKSSQRMKFYLLREGMASTANYLFILSLLAYITQRMLQVPYGNIYTDSLIILAAILYIFVPFYLLRRTTKLLNENKLGVCMIYYDALTQPIINFAYKIKRWKMRNSFSHT